MFKKAIKNLYILAFIFLFVGGVFLLPSMSKIKKADKLEISSAQEKTDEGLWAEDFNGVSTYSLTTKTLFDQTGVYNIQSASDLAYVAYMVNNGIENYSNAKYMLSSNIDLSGSLWTPIGTLEHPFSGTFYGLGYTISNITINDYSCESSSEGNYRYSGLFGYISSATITDINLGGWQQQNITAQTSAFMGTLAGSVNGNSYIINCFDNCETAFDQNGEQLSTIGAVSSESNIFRGGYCYDASSSTYSVLTSKQEILNALTIASGTANIEGFVGVYTFNEGTFRKGDKVWFKYTYAEILEDEKLSLKEEEISSSTMLKVLLDSSLNPINGSDIAQIYHTRKPSLRANAYSHNVYTFREGYKATIQNFTTFDNGLVVAISSQESTIEVTLNHNYGSRNGKYTLPYDTSFKAIFDANPYMNERAGYEFEGLYSGISLDNSLRVNADTLFAKLNPNQNSNELYQNCFPDANTTYYFKWNALSGQSFKVNFAIASDEGGRFDGQELTISQAVNAVSDVYQEDMSVISDTYTGLTSGSNTIYVKLFTGYQIGVLTKNSSSVNVSNNFADKTSGLYVNFKNMTGVGSDYSSANANNDNYSPVAISGGLYNGDVSTGATYEITIENICGQGGEVWIVLEREWLEIELDFEYSIENIECDWEILSEQNGKTLFKKEGNVFSSRRGERPQLAIETRNISTKSYVLSYGATLPLEIVNVGGEDASNINGTIYYQYFTFYLQSISTQDGTLETVSPENQERGKLNFFVGPLESKISLSFVYVNENGKENNLDEKSLYASINNKGNLGVIENVLVPLLPSTKFEVHSSGIYEAQKVSVDGVDVSSEFQTSEIDENTRAITASPAVLIAPYVNGQGLNHTVKIYFRLRTFNTNIEFYFNNTKVEIKDNEIGKLINGITSNSNGLKPTSQVNVEFSLTEIGYGAIYFTKYEVVSMLNNSSKGVHDNVLGWTKQQEEEGYTLSSITSFQKPSLTDKTGNLQLKLGTYNTTVKIYFEYKKVNLEINSLHLQNTTDIVVAGDTSLSSLSASLTFSYNSSEGLKLVADNLGSISLHTQYYLIGWYLKNGEVYRGASATYDGFLRYEKFVDAIALEGSTSEDTVFGFKGISAEVGLRKVNVSYYAGNAGKGQLYVDDKLNLVNESNKYVSAGVVTYGQELTLSDDIFFNLGYAFSNYNAYATNILSVGVVNGLTYKIEGSADRSSWSYLFDKDSAFEYSTMRAWGNFVTDADSQTEATQNVTLQANWSILTYEVKIDDYATLQLSIGDDIYYQTDLTLKNGQAQYFIIRNSDNAKETKSYGTTKAGYVVTGYEIKDTTKATNNYGGDTIFSLTPENFLKFITTENRFVTNDTIITITTLTEPAKYLLYLDNSKNGYYGYVWNESKDLNNYGQNEDGQISINVTFDAVPTNLADAISSGSLIISRRGYTLQGWAISSNGLQSKVFDPTIAYTTASDIHIVPIWRKSSNTTSSTLSFADDVGQVRNFYLEKSHDILNGGFTGDNVSANSKVTDLESVLSNGEIVTDYGFKVTYDGKTTTFEKQNILNYAWFTQAGEYKVVFYVTIKDTLNILPSYKGESYTSTSEEQIFNIVKNEIYFFGHELHSIYNGTNEFIENSEDVAGYDNKFGYFLYKFDWNGADLSATATDGSAIGETNSWFESYVIDGTDFNVGSGKILKATLKNVVGNFGERNLTEIFSNVTDENGKYIAKIEGLTIDKAVFAISFPESSAYYIENIKTIVYNNKNNYNFTYGNVTFNYTFDKIFLVPTDITQGIFKGNENHSLDSANFEIKDLEIKNPASQNESLSNFEWIISKDSTFNLLDRATALQLDYSTKYLSASNGELDSVLSESFNGEVETMSISDVYVDGVLIEIPTGEEQFCIYAESNVILYVAGFNSEKIYTYVNKTQLNEHTLSFNVVINISSERGETLKTLVWTKSTSSISSIETNFDNFTAKYLNNVVPIYNDTNSSYYAVLTDVVKVNIDYNTGKNIEGKESEVIYVSTTSGVEISNPTHEYNGLKFYNYYFSEETNITITSIGEGMKFTTTTGGKTETYKAMWDFISIKASLVKEKHNIKANVEYFALTINSIADISLPKSGVKGQSYVLTAQTQEGAMNFEYSSMNTAFLLENSINRVTPSLSGTYTFTITVEYSDGVRESQLQTAQLEFEVEITKSTISISQVGSPLVYSRERQEGNVELEYQLNNYPVEKISLTDLPTSDESGSNYGVFYSLNEQMLNAGRYTINLTIDSDYSDVFALATDSLEITIDKFSIDLSKYKDVISSQLNKFFGEEDEVPLLAMVTIEENNFDVVSIEFTREAGEGAGQSYKTTCVGVYEDDYKVNYDISNSDNTEFYFVIAQPGGDLRIRLEEAFSYTYNGHAIGGFNVSYDATEEKYLLSASAGSEIMQIYFTIYFGENIQIPDEQKEAYARKIAFTSNAQPDVGVYTLSATLTDEAEDGWTGATITNSAMANITITKRGLNITNVEKVFDRNNLIVAEGVTFDNLIDGDEVYLSGNYSSLYAGEDIPLRNLSLNGAEAGNYSISNLDFKGKITKAQIGSIIFTFNSNFTYGDVNKSSSVAQLVKGGYSFSNGGVTDDITKGYISISGFTVEEQDLSTSEHIKIGDIQIKLFFTSTNFEGLSQSGYAVTMKVNAKELDLSSIKIQKTYDENTSLPKDLSPSINDFIFKKDETKVDDVKIDLTKGGYDDAELGENKFVTILLTGEDSANYTVKNNVRGSIIAHEITLNVVADLENEELVSDGSFVEDGLNPVLSNRSFVVKYPSAFPASETLTSLTLPVRKGYTASGWKYYDESTQRYISITANNIVELLKAISKDEANIDKSLTIYTTWEIDIYRLIFAGENIASIDLSATPKEALGGDESAGYKIKYYSNLELSVVCERGYKIQAINLASGSVESTELKDIGKNQGVFTFNRISSDLRVEITTKAIQTTFKIDFNLPKYTQRTDKNDLTKIYDYVALSTLSESDLPLLSVTEGTYTFSGYSYNGVMIRQQTLKEVVDELYPLLESDIEISLVANWSGELYTIKFDANGGELIGNSEIFAIYGSEISSEFPSAIKEGQSHVWTCEGLTYSQDDELRSIGEKVDGVWTVTFIAKWRNNPYILTVIFDEKLTIYNNSLPITSGQTFEVIYDETSVPLVVEPNTGYVFSYDDTTLNGQISVIENLVTISNLTKNGELTLYSLPADNTLTIYTDKVEGYQAFLVGEEDDNEIPVTEGKLIAKTESVIKVIFTAKKGYIFTEKSTIFAGNGETTKVINDDNKTLTITWSNFIANATLSITGEPDENIVTTGELSNIFKSLSFNGEDIDLKGDSYVIKTETLLNIQGVLVYGYKDGNVNTGNINYVREGSVKNNFSSSDYHYHFTAIIEGFNEDFSLTFTNAPRIFNFSLSVREGDEAYGEITAPSSQTVKFEENLQLSQNELISTYAFDAWLYGSKVLNASGNENVVLSESYKDLLESVNLGETIKLEASYKRKVIDVTFTSRGKGDFTILQPSENVEIAIESESVVSAEIFMGQNLDFIIRPYEGYEVESIVFDGVEQDFAEIGYDAESGLLSIYIELDSVMQSISINFKASKATIYVQAGMRVNYTDYLGTNAGGNIYLVDNQGNRLGEELYLAGKKGQVLIGGDYSVESVTDATLYFVVEAKEGFTLSINASAGVVMHQYEFDEKIIYAFGSVKNLSEITVLFTAKENIVNVKFALEGQTQLAHAGVITADTSSNLVSAIPNRGDNVSISIITGEDLMLGVNSSLSYRLLTDENGKLKYTIIYNDSESKFEDSQIEVGLVGDSDSIKTGYTNSANFKISEVTLGATIIFYVEPREYSVRFNVFDSLSITMQEKVRYGEEWSSNLLTSEEKATVFANRSHYTFLGYYTMPNGQGTQYIDKEGKVINRWLEDGYTFNGSIYQLENNFNDETSTFTLYANWLYNRADVTISFNPSEVANMEKNYNISYVITNLNSLSAWVSQENRWYAEVTIGSTLQIKALKFEGYEFINWIVIYQNSEGITKPESFNLTNLAMGSYEIKAIYQPEYELDTINENNGMTNGGTAELIQDGKIVGGNSFASDKIVTLRATPNEGYKFLYFVDSSSGHKYYGQVDEKGVGSYTYSSLLTKPISVTAVFTGKPIVVNLDSKEVQTCHELISVTINGKQVDYSKPISAQVGDTIQVEIAKSRGYGFEVSGADFTYIVNSSTKNYIFSYTFSLNELIEIGNDSYLINISFKAPRERLRFAFENKLEDAVDVEEEGKVGSLLLASGSNKDVAIQIGSYYTFLYGEEFTLKINANENYTMQKVYLYTGNMVYDISDRVLEGNLFVDKVIMETYFAYEIKIKVFFERLLWTDVRSDNFSGEGTKEKPYLISSVEDFALLTYVVNNGKKENGVKYSEAYYLVTRNLDFKGRYFEPIGTKENPFNGTINLGNYEFENISHYMKYTNPNTSYGGLFWHIGKNAKIMVDDGSIMMIVIVVVIVAVVAIVSIILLIFFLRKRRKKQLEEIANK